MKETKKLFCVCFGSIFKQLYTFARIYLLIKFILYMAHNLNIRTLAFLFVSSDRSSYSDGGLLYVYLRSATF